MTAKQVFDVTEAVLAAVEKNLIDPATGEFYPSNIQKDLDTAADIEAAFVASGFTIPPNVVKALAVGRALVFAFGIK